MDIMKLSAWEIRMLKILDDLAKESFDAAELIQKHFSNSFGINNKIVHVYHTKGNQNYVGDAYITINNTFVFYDNWAGGRQYEFNCDAEGIYKMLRSCYLRQNNLQHLDPEKFDCPIEYIDTYFRRFIAQFKSK